MLELNEDRERQVVPRWRSFASAIQFGEVDSLRKRNEGAFTVAILADSLDEWNDSPTLSVACDVLSVAVSTGLTSDIAEVAKFVAEHPQSPPMARQLGVNALRGRTDSDSTHILSAHRELAFSTLQSTINDARRRLRIYPRNGLLWADLALMHTMAGQHSKAKRAMQVAEELAPHSRFVARSAARLFLHAGDKQKAHEILLSSPLVCSDPWLMASEIALANARRKTSANIRRAKRLLESRNHPLFHVSELAAALATVEAFSGDTRHAQQHCHLALADAAENSVAQVGWLQRACGISSGERFLAASQKSNEASAWNASRAKDWPLAFEFALAWQRDQPFSSRPAILAGGIALTISEDFFAAAKILEPAATCNADDATLGNNLAFAYAKMDKVEQAQGVLERLRSTNANIVQSICLMATSGLLEYRKGNVLGGRSLYEQSVQMATKGGQIRLIAFAKIYRAIEEIRLGAAIDSAFVNEARESLSTLQDSDAHLFSQKLANAFLLAQR